MRTLFAIGAWFTGWTFLGVSFSEGVTAAPSFVVFGVLLAAACTYGGCRIKGMCAGRRAPAHERGTGRFLGTLFVIAALALAYDAASYSARELGGAAVVVSYWITAAVLAVGGALLLGVADRIKRRRSEARQMREAQELAQTAEEVSDLVTDVVVDLFGGWVPRQIKMDADRVVAPARDGSWVPLDTLGAVFALDEESVAAYVCADAVFASRRCAHRDAAAARDFSDPGAPVPGRFIYTARFRVAGTPEETGVTARMLEDLLFCRRVFSYRDLACSVEPARNGTSLCVVSFKAELA